MNNKIVITGATGFLGGAVANCLLERGATVYALVRPQSVAKLKINAQSNFHILEGDFSDLPKFIKLIGKADAFFHFAWGGVNREEIDSPQVQNANVIDSLFCLDVANRLGCQIFLDAGSRVEYGITEDGIMEESMECHPVNAYGKAKLEFYQKAQELCKQWNMTYYHLRYFSVYGSGDHPWSIISTLVRELPQGNTVTLSACKHRWNFMHIKDATDAVVTLYEQSLKHQGECHIVNIASKDTRVLRLFVEEIHRLCDGKGRLEFGTFVQAKEGALSICPELAVLGKLTHNRYQEMVTFEEGIKEMLRR